MTPYTSPPVFLALILKLVPDVRYSVEELSAVAAPPTALVKTPPTLSVVLLATAKLEALVSVKLFVDVALLVIVQPPDDELNITL